MCPPARMGNVCDVTTPPRQWIRRARALSVVGALSVIAVLLAFSPQTAEAASLSFSPSSGTYVIGDTFSVEVHVASTNQAMNAASGVIAFPQDKLEVVSLSKSGSIFSLWVQEPSYLNSAGTVQFEGIVLNPGYTGATGKVITINFKVKAVGSAPLNFSTASVLANDGQGTNILTGIGTARFSLDIAGPTVPGATTPARTPGTPAAPPIASPTHPNPTAWYATRDALFTWPVPSDITGARLLIGKIPQVTPTVAYKSAVSEKTVEDLDDGVWYFHAQLKNAKGWGDVSHFRVQVDTTPPESFSISFLDGTETDNPQPRVRFDASDVTSGIDHYTVKIGDAAAITIPADKLDRDAYTLPVQEPGTHTLFVEAFDGAGNKASTAEEFTIIPLTPPEITDYPHQIERSETLVVKGTTIYPGAQIIILTQKDSESPKRHTVKADTAGTFTFIADKRLDRGTYTLRTQVIDERGAKSDFTEGVTIAVEPQTWFRIGSFAVSILAVFVPLLALLFLLALLMWYGWHRLAQFREQLREDIQTTERGIHKAFVTLREDIQEHLKLLERAKTKRQLTKEEDRIAKQLKRDLNKAEKFLEKEFEEIEKDVE